jgi:hypothetical protein
MRKITLVFLLTVTVINGILMTIALTNKSSSLYQYRFAIGIPFLMFGGFLRRHLLSYNKKAKE